MSIATQVKRLQGVRNQIRAKMVSLGLSTNTDLLQDLANDLDGVALRGDASTFFPLLTLFFSFTV